MFSDGASFVLDFFCNKKKYLACYAKILVFLKVLKLLIKYFISYLNEILYSDETICVLKLSMTYFMQYLRKKLLTKENSTGCALRWGLFYIRCFCNKNNTLPFTCMPKSSFLIDVHVNYDHYQCSLCS